jgi:RimJ/RimL family protein N-acetyltransferase
MNFDLQPTLENKFVKICPLKVDDFETLYSIACDPLIWEQHPNKDRYKKGAFENYFKGAMESKGAFLVFNAKTGKPIGSTRFSRIDEEEKIAEIGYTFIARDHWGTTYNQALKTLMLDHAFNFVDSVIFHIGAVNIRSQKAIEKLGAKKIGEAVVEYYGEAPKLNFTYQIEKKYWQKKKL